MPYPWVKDGIYVADGLAMSCSNTGRCQPSLTTFYEGMQDDLGEKVPQEPDLKYLANQGVLLLNTQLTAEMNKSSSHAENIFGAAGLWDKFIEYLLVEVINFYNSGLIYVSFGESAHRMAKHLVPFIHIGLEVEHPSAANRRERPWKHEKIFSKINKVLKENNNQQINWIYGSTESEPIRAARKE